MRLREQSQRYLELPKDREPPYVGHDRASHRHRFLWQGSGCAFAYHQTHRCIRGSRVIRSDVKSGTVLYLWELLRTSLRRGAFTRISRDSASQERRSQLPSASLSAGSKRSPSMRKASPTCSTPPSFHPRYARGSRVQRRRPSRRPHHPFWSAIHSHRV